MPLGSIPPNFACDECRTRKFKCSKERPSCSLCLQQNKVCSYSPRPERTPLTRQNLSAAEERIKTLEAVLAQLLPNLDLDDFLKASNIDFPWTPKQQSQVPAAQLKTTASLSYVHSRSPASPAAEESLPLRADGFDWVEQETLSELSDGMGALSIQPEGTGYLGVTSSVVPLRALLTGDTRTRSSRQTFASQPLYMDSMVNPLPEPAAPLSGTTERLFIDAYFTFYHTTYPFLHEQTFRAQYQGQIPQPKGNVWPILLNTVLTLGAWCIGDENSAMDDVYYREVNRFSQDTSVFEVGNLTLVQAVLLLSNYTQKRNKPNTGYNYLGLAIRMALSLGLHREFPEWKISLLQREMRRRVWWGIYIFDSGASVTFGRPVLLPGDGIMDADEVLNIHEESLAPTTTALPYEVKASTVYTSLKYQSSFHRTTNPLYHRLISTPSPSATELLSLQEAINSWQKTIPAYFQFNDSELCAHETFVLARYRLSWRTWNLRIILFRPTVLRWAANRWKTLEFDGNNSNDTEEEECRLLCLQSARDTIASISEYMRENVPSRLGSWYMLYFLFQAGLIPIIFLITTPTSTLAPSWLDDLRTTQDLLLHAAKSNSLAGRFLEVIDRLCAPLLEAEQPEQMLHDQGLFNNMQNMFVGEQGLGQGPGGEDGMDFLDWSNFGLQWGV